MDCQKSCSTDPFFSPGTSETSRRRAASAISASPSFSAFSIQVRNSFGSSHLAMLASSLAREVMKLLLCVSWTALGFHRDLDARGVDAEHQRESLLGLGDGQGTNGASAQDRLMRENP